MRLSVCLVAAACTTAGTRSGAAGPATIVDSTADTILVRVTGDVPPAGVLRLPEEMRIAPGANDTSLFTEIAGFVVDRAGGVWVFDRPSNSLFRFDADGKLLRRIGRQGGGPGEFNSENGMVVTGDSGIAVWDSRNARVSFFDAAGAFRTSWLTPTGFSTNDGLITDRSGALFLKRPVTAPREGEILGRMGLVRLKPGGALGDSLVPPDLPVPRDVYVAEHSSAKGGTSRSSTNAPYAPGYHWAWHPDGYFVVADGGKYEIHLGRSRGKPIAIRRKVTPVPIPPEEREEARAGITYSLQMTDPGWSWSGPPLPETKAPMDGLFVARDGRTWARVAAPSERIPDAELAPPRDPKAPVSHFRISAVYEVFSAEGRFLGRVPLPRGARLVEADGDTVWLLVRDENDLPAVVRAHIEPGLGKTQ